MTSAITDFSQYAELRHAAGGNDPAALRQVAGQFEALFLQTMLKSMRDATPEDPLFGGSQSHEMYLGMLDQQLSVEMATGKGVGLADMLVRQLGGGQAGHFDGQAGEGFALQPGAVDRSHALREAAPQQGFGLPERATGNGMPMPVNIPGGYFPSPSRPTGQGFTLPVPASGNVSAGAPAVWQDPESFARDVWPHAERAAQRLNVPAEAVFAQAALETGWGRHVMPASDGSNSHNLFGIKAGANWSGDSVARRTVEFDGQVARRETARFRTYDSVASVFDDYVEFLSANPRYAGVGGQGDDVAGFAEALQRSGYATDPAYADKISRVAGSSTMQKVLAALKTAPESTITQ